MNNKLLLTGLIILLAIGIVFFARTNQGNNVQIDINKSLTGNVILTQNFSIVNESVNENKIAGVTLSTLSEHNSEESCWIVYKNKVYDITSFLPRHAGGINRILPYCGTQEFEKAFTRQHGTSKVSLLMKVGTFIGDFDIVGSGI